MNRTAADPAESIRRNTVFGLAVQLSGALMTGILILFLVRRLGPTDYGIFVLAVGVGSLLLLPSDFGVSQSAARFIAERRADFGVAGRILGDALSLKLLGAGLASVALIALAGPIAAAYGVPDLETPLRLVAVAVFGQSMMGLFAGAFEAFGRNSLGFRLALSESVLEAGSSIALVLAGAGVTGAAAGRAIGFCFGALMGLVLALRLLGPRTIRIAARPRWSFRRIAGYAGALFVIDGAFALFTEIDVLLIGAILTTEEVGLFGAPLKMLTFVFYPGLALAAGVAPRLARGQGREPNVGALETAIRYLLIVQLFFVAPMVVWADPLVDLLFGASYAESAEVLQAFAPYVLLVGLAPLLSIGVNYMGEARRRVPLAIAAVAINAGIDVVLLPEIGIVAGAIGTGAAMLVYVLGHLWICHSILRLRLGRLAATFVRSLVAAGAMAGVLYAFGTSVDLGVPTLLIGGAAGSLAYAAIILLLREFSPAELSVAREALRRRPQPPRVPPVAPAAAEAAAADTPPVAEAPVADAPVPEGPTNAVASYAHERGPSPRRLAGFLIVHTTCGAGFDFNRVGEGRFEAVCLGCRRRFAYSSPGQAPAAPVLEEPAAPVSPVRGPAPRARPEPSRGEDGAGGRWLGIVALVAVIAGGAAAYVIATSSGDESADSPATSAATSERAPAPSRRIETTQYSFTLPAGWRLKRSATGAVLTPDQGGAVAELFVTTRPDLDLEAIAAETAVLLAKEHEGGKVSEPVAVEVGGSPGLELRASFVGGVERATLTAEGDLRYVLFVEVKDDAVLATRAEAALIERTFRPAPG